ncbi:MAG: hypothetical protein LBH42_04875 [Treponema sp.]|nr:hypothetical protein [Treponema sp.]
MKKTVAVILFCLLGTFGFSQTQSYDEKHIIGMWSDDARDEHYEFDKNGKVQFQTYITTRLDSTHTNTYWEAYLGTYSVEGRIIKIQYAAKANEMDLVFKNTDEEKELEIISTDSGQVLFDGRHHFLKRL